MALYKTTRVCKTCGVDKPLTEYNKQSNRTSYYTWCKECHKVLNRKSKLKRLYGITPGEYDDLYKKQNGCCEICGKHQSEQKRRLDIDHNHTTGKVRSLLCTQCNVAIGLFEENIDTMMSGIEYLKGNR